MAKHSLHEKITHQILEAMKNATSFQMPWHTEQALPSNASTNNHYQGINTISLWSRSSIRGFESSQWATYNQWLELGAQVQKGERGSTIIIYKPMTDNDGEAIYLTEPPYKPKAFITSATVFNANQVSGFEPVIDSSLPTEDLTLSLANVDNYITSTKVSIDHQGTKAFYNHQTDVINMPKRTLFTGTSSSTPTEAYYSTLLHELVHWTGDDKRCNRDHSGHFGEGAYAREELVAELGSAFLCAELGINAKPRPDHASYIKSWIKVLRNDSKAIFLAASKATDAIHYLNHLHTKSIGVTKPLFAKH